MSNSLKKNFSIVFGTQGLILLVSVARALVLPKLLTVESFGYWEVYWFYATYCGVFCLGFTDGVYLKYGGYDYHQLPMKKLRSSTRLFIGMLCFFSVISAFLLLIFSHNDNIRFSLFFVILDIVVVGITSLYIYIFQVTNQFGRYGVFSVFDKIFVLILILYLFATDLDNYKIVVLVDFFSKVFVLSLMIWKSKEIIFGEVDNFKQSFYEMLDNINIGIKLMFANLMGMLIMGAGKLAAQLFGNIEDFAIYSFGVSVTGLVLTAVTAFSLVLYPAIKRIEESKYPNLFNKIDSFTRFFGITSVLLYFPCVYAIKIIYPNYTPVLFYLNLLFVIVFLQCKINILNNTFFKTLRKERQLLYVNIASVGIFILLLSVLYPLYKKIYIIPFCTSISMSILYFVAKRYLCQQMNLKVDKRTVYEFFFVLIFILVTTFSPITIATLIIFALYLIFLMIDYKTNREIVSEHIRK